MAWEEWEQLKAEAAQRQPARLQLNQVPPQLGGSGQDGATGGMKSDKAAWTKAGDDVSSLGKAAGRALTKLEEGQKGTDTGGSGVQSAAAQREVYASWARYVKDVSGRCRYLGQLMEKSGNDQFKNDQAISAELEKLAVKYKDTPAVGGQSKGQ